MYSCIGKDDIYAGDFNETMVEYLMSVLLIGVNQFLYSAV